MTGYIAFNVGHARIADRLYRDDGLLLLKGTGGHQAELARKQLHETFKKFNLRITAEITYLTVKFLGVT